MSADIFCKYLNYTIVLIIKFNFCLHHQTDKMMSNELNKSIDKIQKQQQEH